MEPEEIDKLFKDRLAGLPAIPPANAWMRLQQKMEPPKKTRSMWIYYAAASITLLIISGIWFFTNQSTLNNGTLATINKPKASTSSPVKKEAPVLVIPEENITTEPQIAQTENVQPEVKQKANAPIPAVVERYAKIQAPVIAKVKKPYYKENNLANKKASPIKHLPTSTTSAPEERLAFAKPDKPLAAEDLTASIIEVKIIRDSPEAEERSELRENLARKTSLLKNIYKQARNLKNGEQVELASLGINTEKLNSEKKEIKEKLNKVISL